MEIINIVNLVKKTNKIEFLWLPGEMLEEIFEIK